MFSCSLSGLGGGMGKQQHQMHQLIGIHSPLFCEQELIQTNARTNVEGKTFHAYLTLQGFRESGIGVGSC